MPNRAKDAVNGGGRNLTKFFENFKRKRSEFLLISWEPDREDRLEAFGARKVGGDPNLLEDGKEFRLIVFGFGAGFATLFFSSLDFESSQAPDGIFSVIATSSTEFTEDLRFLAAECLFVAFDNSF